MEEEKELRENFGLSRKKSKKIQIEPITYIRTKLRDGIIYKYHYSVSGYLVKIESREMKN